MESLTDDEMNEPTEEEAMDVDDVDQDIDFESSSKVFQKDNWRFKFLPYYDLLTKEADRAFEVVKTYFAQAIIDRNMEAFDEAIREFLFFQSSYNKRYTKHDQLMIARMMCDALVLKDLDYRLVRSIASVIPNILGPKNMITRDDFRVDWRPLYDLYRTILFKDLEDDGLILFPPNIKDRIVKAVVVLKCYFEDNATQEILDTLRPHLVPFSEVNSEACYSLATFLPTTLQHVEHDKFGAKLWFDELWYWYTSGELNKDNETRLLEIFSNLATSSASYINWRDKLPFLLNKLMQSCGLQVSHTNVGSDESTIPQIATILAFSLGGVDDEVQNRLSELFLSWENFFHPSNSGRHVSSLLSFVAKLVQFLALRVSFERHNQSRRFVQTPPEHCITDAQIDALVESLMPCLNYAAFGKVTVEVPKIFKYCAFLSPGIVLPVCLDLFYPALQTLTEPHRLLQTLNVLMNVLVPLSRDEYKEGRIRHPMKLMEEEGITETKQSLRVHMITILNNILPGLDVNDSAKAALTFEIIALIFALMPVVDCSDAPRVRNDLTPEEIEICSATAMLEGILDQIMDRCFSMIESHASCIVNNTRQFATDSGPKSLEENITERGVFIVFKFLTVNCSSAIYKRAVSRFYDFVTDRVFDARPAIDATCRLVAIFVNTDPAYAFPMFFDYFWKQLKDLVSDDTPNEEELENGILWYSTLLCEAINQVQGPDVVAFKERIFPALNYLFRFQAREVYIRASTALENCLIQLTTVYPTMTKKFMETNDLPFEQYLPIRNWAKRVKKNDWKLFWHIPTDEEIDLAREVSYHYLQEAFQAMEQPEPMTDKTMLKVASVVLKCTSGISAVIPMFDGKPVSYKPILKKIYLRPTTLPDSVKRIAAPDGRNMRRYIYERVKKILTWLLGNRPNYTKVVNCFISTVRHLLIMNGISNIQFAYRASHHEARRRVLQDPIRGVSMTIETLLSDSIWYIHQRRMFEICDEITELHVDALHLLTALGMSPYTVVRQDAQMVLYQIAAVNSYTYKLYVDKLIDVLKNREKVSHEEFKGCLHMLKLRKQASCINKPDWVLLQRLWPSLICSLKSEKISINELFDDISKIISDTFSSFSLQYTMPESFLTNALQFFDEYPGMQHKVLIRAPTKDALEASRKQETLRNKANVAVYYELTQSLYTICNDANMHWRQVQMAQTLLSLLLRRDIEFPTDMLVMYARLLTHDVQRIRRISISIITSWQKIAKVKCVKERVEIDFADPNTQPGAKWPISFGLRNDNAHIVRLMNKIPETPEEYNSVQFFTKFHLGFYTWPKDFLVSAPVKEQKAANRDLKDLSEQEKAVLAVFQEPGFIDRLVCLYSIEEEKAENEELNEFNVCFFYRLFRNIGPVLWANFATHLDELLQSKKNSKQRLAAEIICGVLIASKLWTYERRAPIVDFLEGRLARCFENVSDEAIDNWCIAIGAVFNRLDPRQTWWLYKLIMDMLTKSTESSFHASFHLRLLHSAIVQYEWRAPIQLRNMFYQALSFVARNSRVLRERVGVSLTTCVLNRVAGAYIEPSLELEFKPIALADMIGAINRELRQTIWPEVLTDGFDDLTHIWGNEFTNTIPWLPQNGDLAIPRVLSMDHYNLSESRLSLASSTPSDAGPSGSDIGTEPMISPHLEFPERKTSQAGAIGRTPRSNRRTLTPPVTKLSSKDTDKFGRKRDKVILLSLANSICSTWAVASPEQLYPAYELLPLFAHFANDVIDEELSSTCQMIVIHEMAPTCVKKPIAEHILRIVHLSVTKSCAWKTRITVTRFLQITVFSNIYVYRQYKDEIRAILDLLLVDPRLEVRSNAQATLSGFVQCGLFAVDADFLKAFTSLAENEDGILRHAGVMGLSAVVMAAPYKVPPYIPDVLMTICKHIRDPQPIYATCKRTLNEFKRTHTDCWKDHKSQFNEDQLQVLTNLLVSPNYYV